MALTPLTLAETHFPLNAMLNWEGGGAFRTIYFDKKMHTYEKFTKNMNITNKRQFKEKTFPRTVGESSGSSPLLPNNRPTGGDA